MTIEIVEVLLPADPATVEVTIPGPQGPQGETGPQGLPGDTGPQGPAGETGPQGPQGEPGPQGETGEAGASGGVWRSGSGAPSNSLGADNDYYLDTATGDVYARASGTYSIVTNILGPAGADGADGADGAQGPQGDPGADGADGASAYEVAVANGFIGSELDWLASLVGPQGEPGLDGADGAPGADGSDGAPGADGADGAVWRSGSGAPSNSLGIDGDFYLDTATGDVYEKASGSYSVVANIIGPQGPAGADGADGATGPQGDPGPAGNDGAPGADGADGADGIDGKTVLSGSGAPASGLGADGDFYIDTTAWEIYGPKATTWGSGTSLIGPQGEPGETGPQGPQGEPGETPSGAIGSSGLTMTSGKLLGRYSTSTGAIEEITISTGLSLDGSGNLTATGGGGGGGLTLAEARKVASLRI